jgi:hypothetical protein
VFGMLVLSVRLLLILIVGLALVAVAFMLAAS